MNLIKDLYLKKLDEDTQELKNILTNLKTQKDLIENSINSIPNGFSNIVNSNDYVQGGVVSLELKKLNNIDNNLSLKIEEKSKINPLLFIENYETNYLELSLPYGGQYVEGEEIVNRELNFIENSQSRLIMKYLQNQIYISLSIDINMPLNSPNFPKFFTYITLKNKKYGVEFINLSEQAFPQDLSLQGNVIGTCQQINSFRMDAKPFLSLVGPDKKIRLKIFVIKIYYK